MVLFIYLVKPAVNKNILKPLLSSQCSRCENYKANKKQQYHLFFDFSLLKRFFTTNISLFHFMPVTAIFHRAPASLMVAAGV